MWAIVTDGSITKIINQPKPLVIGDTQYSKNIFSFRWSNEEREAIGLYEVVFDNTNKKDEAYYTNTNQSFAFAGGVVTASYGSANAKALADVTNEDDSISPGLKTQHKDTIKQQASSLLATYDWYVIRKADAGTAVPSAVTTYRAAVRTKSGEMETLIDNAANVDALAALYEYTEQEDGSQTRPLGEFPEAV